MAVFVEPSGPVLVCRVQGNLEHSTVVGFREAVARMGNGQLVVFELSAVPFIDSAGIGALIGAVRRQRDRGGDAVVSGARPSLLRLFHMIGVRRVVSITGSIAEAKDLLLADATTGNLSEQLGSFSAVPSAP